MKKQSFERFYLTRIALGDCCGCAERVIDWRDIELAAQCRDKLNHGKPVIGRPRLKLRTIIKYFGVSR